MLGNGKGPKYVEGSDSWFIAAEPPLTPTRSPPSKRKSVMTRGFTATQPCRSFAPPQLGGKPTNAPVSDGRVKVSPTEMTSPLQLEFELYTQASPLPSSRLST